MSQERDSGSERTCSTHVGSVYMAGCSWPVLCTASTYSSRGATHGLPYSRLKLPRTRRSCSCCRCLYSSDVNRARSSAGLDGRSLGDRLAGDTSSRPRCGAATSAAAASTASSPLLSESRPASATGSGGCRGKSWSESASATRCSSPHRSPTGAAPGSELSTSYAAITRHPTSLSPQMCHSAAPLGEAVRSGASVSASPAACTLSAYCAGTG